MTITLMVVLTIAMALSFHKIFSLISRDFISREDRQEIIEQEEETRLQPEGIPIDSLADGQLLRSSLTLKKVGRLRKKEEPFIYKSPVESQPDVPAIPSDSEWLAMQGIRPQQIIEQPQMEPPQTGPPQFEQPQIGPPQFEPPQLEQPQIGPPQTATEISGETPLGSIATGAEPNPFLTSNIGQPVNPQIPSNIGQPMSQPQDGHFYNPPPDYSAMMKQYTQREIIATVQHFNRELLLVAYTAETDDFIVLLPGYVDQPRPICDGGCIRIKNIIQTVLFAFRKQMPFRFPQYGGKDLLFLVSTGDLPRLTRQCLEHPIFCKRQIGFAPILHFGSLFQDKTILPSVVLMPPPAPLTRHLKCMQEWQISHRVCDCLLPKQTSDFGGGNCGFVFGEHVNNMQWEDLKPQVVWRGGEVPYLPLLYPHLRKLDYEEDIEPVIEDYGDDVEGVIRAARDVYDTLQPRWKAVVITAEAENDAKKSADSSELPWANMKFFTADFPPDQWNNLGIPAMGDEMSLEELAKFKYHIDIAGGRGTAMENPNTKHHNPGTLEKLALPGLLFHHVSGAKDWFHEHLVPWVHYVPVKEDLSDLRQMYEWAEENDEKARAIANAGTDFVRQMGRPEGMDELYRRHLLKPLQDIIEAFQPIEATTILSVVNDGGLVFADVMRCNGYNVNECILA